MLENVKQLPSLLDVSYLDAKNYARTKFVSLISVFWSSVNATSHHNIPRSGAFTTTTAFGLSGKKLFNKTCTFIFSSGDLLRIGYTAWILAVAVATTVVPVALQAVVV